MQGLVQGALGISVASWAYVPATQHCTRGVAYRPCLRPVLLQAFLTAELAGVMNPSDKHKLLYSLLLSAGLNLLVFIGVGVLCVVRPALQCV